MSGALLKSPPPNSATDPPAGPLPDGSTAQKTAKAPLTARLARFGVALLSILNLAAVLGLLILLCVVSERWWFSLAFSYLPRAPYLAPSLVLTAVALLVRRRWVWVNLFSLMLVAVPIMGLRVPLTAWAGSPAEDTLTVVTCNLQGGVRDLTKIIQELDQIKPDVVVLQEAAYGFEPLIPYFEGWSQVHWGEYLVASRYPVQLRDVCRAEAFRRGTAMLCEIEGPRGPFLICDTHLTTARHGLASLRPDSVLTGTGVDKVKARQSKRKIESFETRTFASQHGSETPLLVMGDFNAPTSSSLFQKYWSDFTSAFDAAGFGYGYTSPCTGHRRWPVNTPWLRIDHILCSSHWEVDSCWIGRSDGSDHRLVAARLHLRDSD